MKVWVFPMALSLQIGFPGGPRNHINGYRRIPAPEMHVGETICFAVAPNSNHRFRAYSLIFVLPDNGIFELPRGYPPVE